MHHQKATLLALALLAFTARAQDPDGGYAPAERWTHPRGPASGSARSYAASPATFGGVLWKLKAKKAFLAPPVTWDGIAYVVDGSSEAATLLAVQARSGKVMSRVGLKEPGTPRPALHDHSVFLLEEDRLLVQYRFDGRKLARRWSFDGGSGCSPARVLKGEIYLPTRKGLLRLRAGSKKPVWTAPGEYAGEPAVFGGHVYALERREGTFRLAVYRRLDGERVVDCELGPAPAGAQGGNVVISSGLAAVLLPPAGKQTWSLIEVTAGETPTLRFARKVKLLTEPMGGRTMMLALDDQSRWAILRVAKKKPPMFPLTDKQQRPDLVVGAAASTFLSDGVVCFGSWAADVNANQVLWHIDERKDTRGLENGVRFCAVPYDHERLLLVTRDGRTLCAIGPEEIGS